MPDEISPKFDIGQSNPGAIDSFEARWSADLDLFWESLRVRKSSLWSSVCGEIVMKGWVPASSVQSPHSTKLPVLSVKPLSDKNYVVEALALLGKLGDRRVGPHAIQFLEDPERGRNARVVAAVCLGNLKFAESLPRLLQLIESKGEESVNMDDEAKGMSLPTNPSGLSPALIRIICETIIKIDEPGVVPELQRISAVLRQRHSQSPKEQEAHNYPILERVTWIENAAEQLKMGK